MRKILLTLALLFSVNAAYAADAGNSWYENLMKGLKTKVQKKLESKNRVSAVAAVRGAKQGSDARALYWKGGVSDAAQKKLEAERKQLTDAVQLVLDGDNKGAKAAFEKFIKDNPESVFLPEAKEAIEKLPADKPVPAADAAKPAAANPEAVAP
ncbi:MAG: hypothetical protein A2234_04635 [Elusimicrobia bacterium RIFOXYA2_FULL_58_8]|nr:MAG: hypothetical protein A2234_04635 [Elusimicrobia bacterium RIFOXYA2_FULL_58_8]OGS14010.1 MAG: hypothetical protein A2285_02830 [Elusimicrobia bacterium RIFOXYA12_FULL_57_11]